jgi:FkbM family methyltransferase
LRNGLNYIIRNHTSDFRILREVWIANDYQRPGFQIRAQDVVVDIGAQIGVFTVRAATAAPGVRVVSFEPFPDNYRLLQANVELNDLSHVTPVNQAVSAIAETRDLYISEVNTGGHSFFGAGPSGKTVEVETTTLPDLMTAHDLTQINFLKMDCEGAEVEILEACPAETLACIDKMVIETHERDHPTGRGWVQRLRDHGFETQMHDNLLCVKRRRQECPAAQQRHSGLTSSS